MLPEPTPSFFDEDPEENLRIENAILKLKLQAEWGAHIYSDDNMPPELEAEFLRRVSEFENAWQDVKMVKIFDLLGQPRIIDVHELTRQGIKNEVGKIISLLNEQNISIAIPSQIDISVFYTFLTKEFLHMETEDLQIEGLIKHFDYYEFYPDHKKEIRDCATRFLDNWLRKNTDGLNWDLEDQIVQPNGLLLERKVVQEMILEYFDPVTVLKAGHFQVQDVQFKWEDETGVGHVKGSIYYEAENENMSTDYYSGPFMIYLTNDSDFWSIYYFEIPGFSWGI